MYVQSVGDFLGVDDRLRVLPFGLGQEGGPRDQLRLPLITAAAIRTLAGPAEFKGRVDERSTEVPLPPDETSVGDRPNGAEANVIGVNVEVVRSAGDS